jgi:hypothetical protein
MSEEALYCGRLTNREISSEILNSFCILSSPDTKALYFGRTIGLGVWIHLVLENHGVLMK